MTSEELQLAIEKLVFLQNTSQFNEAKEFAFELLAQQAVLKDAESLAKVYDILGLVNQNLSDYATALLYYSKALIINEEIGRKDVIASSFGNIGNVYQSLSEYPKALEFHSKALLIDEEIENKSGIAINLGNIGNVYQSLSDYQKALMYHNKALQVDEEIGNKVGIARHFMNIGTVFINFSDYHKALEFYEKALQIFEEISNKDGIARNLGNIGNVYRNLSDYTKSLEYYEKALVIFEEIGNKDAIALSLGNIGNVYNSLSEYPTALEYYSKALHIDEEIGKKNGIARHLGNIGNVYNLQSDYPKALEYYENALHIDEEIGNKTGIAIDLVNIGNVFATKESTFYDAFKSEEYLQKALSFAEEIGAKFIVKNAYIQLTTLRLNEERYKEALEFQSKSLALEKEIQSIEAKKQADRFDFERKTSEREKQFAVERADAAAVKRILHNILPAKIADRIIHNETFIADHLDSVSVLFMDLVGFTKLASIAPPKQLVFLLDAIFQKADEVVENCGLEKIKTIGDGYLAVANVTTPLEDHQISTAFAALQLLETMKDFTVNIPSDLGNTDWIKEMNDIEIRIGIHTGEVVAGIIGKNKYTFDLWGDAVNVASRMESHSEAWKIHISETFAKSIEHHAEFKLISRGTINIKGKGAMNTFWLERAE